MWHNSRIEKMQLTNISIDLLDTGIFSLDGGAMFGVVPKVMWAKAYHPGDELNRIPLSARPVLIRTNDKNILIDTGNGTKVNEKMRKIYSIDYEKSDIEKALHRLNLKAEDIHYVIFTHLHFDHCGGATKIIDNKIVPTFPNAKHIVQKDQLMWALNPTEKDRASFLKENFEPLLNEGLIETLDGSGELLPNIEVIPVFGHTKAMQLIKIKDENQTLLYCADICPTSAHINIPFVMGYDNHPLITIEEKKKILPQAYEENWILIFEHDAFKQAGKIKSTEKGFELSEEIIISEYIKNG